MNKKFVVGVPRPSATGPRGRSGASVGPHGDGNAQCCVERREGDAGEHAELAVLQAEFGLDRFEQNDENLPVDMVERVDERQHHEDPETAGIGMPRGQGQIGVHQQGPIFWRAAFRLAGRKIMSRGERMTSAYAAFHSPWYVQSEVGPHFNKR